MAFPLAIAESVQVTAVLQMLVCEFTAPTPALYSHASSGHLHRSFWSKYFI